ncbi:hypothetical protein OXYTRIMIC_389 [Oxytricha trifallax]|uniref:Uncharacterized protein n=1 Tax=Oxytricha trifallax TaxID=1172189 RepID=A0A073HZI2_9SPIT|nr:hypothetical protein OXYTRIMIC_389 [Oxytricha trifallax]
MGEAKTEAFCGLNEVEQSIRECNFNKAIGPDGFYEKILGRSKSTRKTGCMKIASWLNAGQIPQYLKEGRLILLSKTAGDRYPEVNNARPIEVNSNLGKIIEKVILYKLQSGKCSLLQTGNYQSRFKENKIPTQTELDYQNILQIEEGRISKERHTCQQIYKRHTTLSRKTNQWQF